MSKILCRNCKSELTSATEMLSLLRQAHAVFYLLEEEIGNLGYGASRVSMKIKNLVREYEAMNEKEADQHLDPKRLAHCECSHGLTVAGCPSHDENGELEGLSFIQVIDPVHDVEIEKHQRELRKFGNGVDY